MLNYLQKYSHFKRPLLDEPIDANTSLIIVVPCFNENNGTNVLNSLTACTQPTGNIEVIVVINASETASSDILEQNKKTAGQIEAWKINNNNSWLNVHLIIENALPKKHAGVGLARKIGMDEAVWRFHSINKPFDGIIVCLDMDSLVTNNYFIELEKHFESNPKTPGCSIHFEHPVNEKNAESIINYELHLRYFINAQRFAGHLHAFQTVGSSMAVRAHIYAKQGGMPKRQAGEDFYFLHKVIALGNFTELNSTMVIPSDRESDRVPFGTGRDIFKQKETDKVYTTYNFQSFVDLKAFLDQVPSLFERSAQDVNCILPETIQSFLASVNGLVAIEDLKQNTTTYQNFSNRFYQWFNAFLLMKYCHYVRDHFYPDQELDGEVTKLLTMLNQVIPDSKLLKLKLFRKLDKSVY